VEYALQAINNAAAAVGVSEALSRLGADEDDGDLAVPLWFKVEAFTAPEFDADEYVRDLRRYVRAPRPATRAKRRAPKLTPGRPATGTAGASGNATRGAGQVPDDAEERGARRFAPAPRHSAPRRDAPVDRLTRACSLYAAALALAPYTAR
jgi:hypothetical protein